MFLKFSVSTIFLFKLFFAAGILLVGFNETCGQKRKALQKSKSIVISCGVCNKKAIFLPQPEYPKTAIAVRASGKVVVQILIDEKGNVIKAEVISGHPLLWASSVKAALLAKFEPFSIGRKSVRASSTIIYNYFLDSSDQSNQEKFTGYAIELPKPLFPSLCDAKFRKNEDIIVEAEIDENGNTTSAVAISGHPCLKPGAVQAAGFSKFEPSKVAGSPVKAKAQIIYTFVLESKVCTSVLVNWVNPIGK